MTYAGDSRLSPRRHGGNKDEQAEALSRWLDAALTAAAGDLGACSYPAHRGTDWRLTAEHPVVCGVCHPPAAGLAVQIIDPRPIPEGP